jgi:hypothetical protein
MDRSRTSIFLSFIFPRVLELTRDLDRVRDLDRDLYLDRDRNLYFDLYLGLFIVVPVVILAACRAGQPAAPSADLNIKK